MLALDITGRRICGSLYTGFSGLQTQLSLVSGQVEAIASAVRSVDQRLNLLIDETRTSNLLQENIAELLRIPDSQRQRQHHIEMGLKFLKNALKDEDLYQDALTELLEAEKLMPSDYFVLHRIGLILLYVPNLANLQGAAEYFTRAGKYAAVESEPAAARLSNILNLSVSKRFNEQAGLTPDDIGAVASESYFQAGTALYALSRFADAAKFLGKSVNLNQDQAKYRFYLAKYLSRAGDLDAAGTHLEKAVKLAPEMALCAIADLDLNRAKSNLDLLGRLDDQLTAELKEQLTSTSLHLWPADDYQHGDAKKVTADSDTTLGKGNYFEKVMMLAKIRALEERLPFARQLGEIASVGIPFDRKLAEELLRQDSSDHAKVIWGNRSRKFRIVDPALQVIAKKRAWNVRELVTLACANDSCFGPPGEPVDGCFLYREGVGIYVENNNQFLLHLSHFGKVLLMSCPSLTERAVETKNKKQSGLEWWDEAVQILMSEGGWSMFKDGTITTELSISALATNIRFVINSPTKILPDWFEDLPVTISNLYGNNKFTMKWGQILDGKLEEGSISDDFNKVYKR